MELFKLFGTIGLKGVEETQQDLRDTTDQAESGGTKMESAFKKIGAAVATYLTIDTIKQFGKAVVDASAEVSAEVSAFEQIMGDYSDNAQEKMNQVADATGVVSTRLTPYMTSLTAKFKGLGYDVDEATTLASDGLMLASDAAAFWDKSLDDSMGALNSFINGSYEGGEAIGLFANDTQMASYAVSAGIVKQTKDWSSLDEATKQATRLEYAQAMFKMSGATGQAAKEASQYANVQANLNEKWRQFKAQIGEPILQNIVLPAMQKLSSSVDILSSAFETLTNFVNNNKTAFELICVAVGTLTTAILAYNIAQNASAIVTGVVTAATTAWGAVMAFVTSPITLVVAAIGALIAIGVLLYRNWDSISKFGKQIWTTIKTTISNLVTGLKTNVVNTFNSVKSSITSIINTIKTTISNVFNNVKTTVSSIFNSIYSTASRIWNSIKSAIITPINSALRTVKNVINSIKNAFNFSWSLPKLKLPHVSIKGSFSLVPPSVPSFGISWYKKAMDNPMVLDSPTIFGMKDGKLLGGGEAGEEVVSGKQTLMNMIREAVGINDMSEVVSLLKQILAVITDEDKIHEILVKALTDGSFAIVLDNREVGRIVRKYA